MHARLLSLLIISFTLFLSGCGYQLLTAQPVACQALYLLPVAEHGSEIGLALEFREQLAAKLAARGAVLSAVPKGSACTIGSEIVTLETTMSGSGYSEQQVDSYRQKAAARCWLDDQSGKRLFNSGIMNTQEIFLASPDLASSQLEILATESSRRRDLRTLADNLAQECLDRLEEKWLQ